jgi:hypothetical protein
LPLQPSISARRQPARITALRRFLERVMARRLDIPEQAFEPGPAVETMPARWLQHQLDDISASFGKESPEVSNWDFAAGEPAAGDYG